MKKKIFITFISFLVVCCAVLAWIIWEMLRPAHLPTEDVVLTIHEGEGVNQISRNLKNHNLIANSLVFETYVWAIQSENKIIAGRYALNTGLNVMQVTAVLLGGKVVTDDNITFIEGWNRREYAKRLEAQGFSGDEFLEATAKKDTWRDDFPLTASIPEGKSLEGYLFPDTYRLNNQSTVTSLVEKMLSNFEKKISDSLLQDIIKGKHTLYEIMTMASIIEKEVPNSADKKMVADIFWKRIDANIGLQSDATINFITNKGTTRPSLDDLQIDSPYNTYKYRGLPPGPISNPGIESIEAAVHPTANPYYYFLTDPEGNVYYARDLEEHKKNRELYLK